MCYVENIFLMNRPAAAAAARSYIREWFIYTCNAGLSMWHRNFQFSLFDECVVAAFFYIFNVAVSFGVINKLMNSRQFSYRYFFWCGQRWKRYGTAFVRLCIVFLFLQISHLAANHMNLKSSGFKLEIVFIFLVLVSSC